MGGRLLFADLTRDERLLADGECYVCRRAKSAPPAKDDGGGGARDVDSPLRMCPRCRIRCYCSREHQRLDWQRHRHECRAFVVVEQRRRARAAESQKQIPPPPRQHEVQPQRQQPPPPQQHPPQQPRPKAPTQPNPHGQHQSRATPQVRGTPADPVRHPESAPAQPANHAARPQTGPAPQKVVQAQPVPAAMGPGKVADSRPPVPLQQSAGSAKSEPGAPAKSADAAGTVVAVGAPAPIGPFAPSRGALAALAKDPRAPIPANLCVQVIHVAMLDAQYAKLVVTDSDSQQHAMLRPQLVENLVNQPGFLYSLLLVRDHTIATLGGVAIFILNDVEVVAHLGAAISSTSAISSPTAEQLVPRPREDPGTDTSGVIAEVLGDDFALQLCIEDDISADVAKIRELWDACAEDGADEISGRVTEVFLEKAVDVLVESTLSDAMLCALFKSEFGGDVQMPPATMFAQQRAEAKLSMSEHLHESLRLGAPGDLRLRWRDLAASLEDLLRDG